MTDPTKSLKVIKDHHKGVAVTNLAFCEWKKAKRPQNDFKVNLDVSLNENETEEADPSNPYGTSGGNPYERAESSVSDSPYVTNTAPVKKTKKSEGDLTAWMFVSIDAQGRVLVNTI